MPDAGASLPLVSVVTPSYNQGEFIAETIESVLGQDYRRIEYLVMDGGSTDGTLETLRRYDGRLRWQSEPDDGQSDAISRGFALAKGEIIAWVNADDIYTPWAVARAVETFLAYPEAALVYGRAELMDRDGLTLGDQAHLQWDFDILLNRGNYIPQTSTFFRRSAYDAVGGISVDLHYVMDYDLWLKLGRQFLVVDVPDVLARVRMYPETKTASGGLPRIEEMRQMIARHGRADLPEWHEWDALRASVLGGTTALQRRRVTEGMKLITGAIPRLRHSYVRRNAVRFLGRRNSLGAGKRIARGPRP